MNQIVLLNTYTGLSDFEFFVSCTGSRLEREEVFKRGLLRKDQLRRHAASEYTREWYEVKPGDIIIVEHRDDDRDPPINRKRTFRVPEAGMSNPNTDLDNFAATGPNLEDHLRQQCELVREEPYL
jgi:hypothetical protein